MSGLSKPKRIAGFDILKCFCALLIVCMHFPFPSTAGQLVNVLTRIAVPVFFMITGYFYDSTVQRGREKKQIAKILKLTVAANLGYFVIYALGHLVKKDIGAYLVKVFSPKSLFEFFVLNESPFEGHLWYLGALLYVLVIAYLLNKAGKLKILMYLAPVLIIAELFLGRYSVFVFGEPLNMLFSRNFLFTGLPFFGIGMMIKRAKVPQSPVPFFIAAVVFYLTSVFEKYLPQIAGFKSDRENYLSTALLAISVFLIFETVYSNRTPSRFGSRLAAVGLKYSAWIYIIHPLAGKAMAFAVKKVGLFNVYNWVQPFAVFAASLLISILIIKLLSIVSAKVSKRSES